MTFSHDSKLNDIAARALAGERLAFADGVALYETNDLPALGKLADTSGATGTAARPISTSTGT